MQRQCLKGVGPVYNPVYKTFLELWAVVVV